MGHIPADITDRQTFTYIYIQTYTYTNIYLPPPGAEQTSGSLLQEGLFLCGPRGVTNIITPHRLVGAVLAIPFRSENLVTSLPREGTNNFEVCSFNLVPIGPLVPGSLSSHLRVGASTAINTARPGLPHILSAPTKVYALWS